MALCCHGEKAILSFHANDILWSISDSSAFIFMYRLSNIEFFEQTKYWNVQVEAQLLDGKSYPLSWKVPNLDVVEGTRIENTKGNEECAFVVEQILLFPH